jgi:hypothetical protein
VPSGDWLPPLAVSNFGLQIRYRFEFGPMSELFVVYGRGGFDQFNDEEHEIGDLLRNVSDVRDADQLLIKLRYRL